jgi:hypothetical protein
VTKFRSWNEALAGRLHRHVAVDRDAEARRRARARWPIARFQAGQEPSDDLSDVTTPVERIAMMAELAHAAWTLAGRQLPDYKRSDIPGRLFRPGETRPDDDDA